MTGRPPFSLDAFIRVRAAFDNGRGSRETWARFTAICLWRLDEIAEQVGSRGWATIFGPLNDGPNHDVPQRLHHAVRSAGLGSFSVLAFWRSRTGRVSSARARIVFEIDAQRTARIAGRYAQVAALHVQRVPYEQVIVINASDGERVQLRRYEPTVIAEAVAKLVGADALAVEYVPTGWFELLLMRAAEQRRRGDESE